MFGFFKPKWQHRNPKVRIDAIKTQELDKELILKIAQTDLDLSVRMAAIELITELNVLYAILLQQSCQAGKKAVLQKIAHELSETETVATAFQSFMKDTVRRDFPLADLLMVAKHKGLKRHIFAKMDVQKDLPKLMDNNYVITMEDVALVKDRGLLLALSKYDLTDKKLLLHIKSELWVQEEVERKQALKVELLQKYQDLVEDPQLPALNIFSELEKSWNDNALGDENQKYKEDYLDRYHAQNAQRQEKLSLLQDIEQKLAEDTLVDYAVILSSLRDLSSESLFSIKERANIQALIQQIENTLTQHKKTQLKLTEDTAIIAEAEKQLAKNHRIDAKEWASLRQSVAALDANHPQRADLLTKIAQKMESQQSQVQFDGAAFQASLIALEEMIESGSLQQAEQLNHELLGTLKTTDNQQMFAHYHRLLKQVTQPMYDQLDTAKWSALQNIEILCEQAEALADETSVELVSLTLKQLRNDWNEARKLLNRIPQKLYQRFENACQKAHGKVVDARNHDNQARKVYLDEAHDLLKTLAQFVDQIDWQAPDWANLLEARQKFLQEWNRYLDQYSTDGRLSYGAPLFLNKDKQKLEKLMKKTLKPFDQAITAERIKEKERREAEIAYLNELLVEERIKEAVEKAKYFNQNFKPTVRSKRHEENVLWKALRLVNDQIFALREELFSAEESEKTKNAQQKRALITELKNILSTLTVESSESSVHNQVENINNAWLDIGTVSKKEYGKFESELKALNQKINDRFSALELEKSDNIRLSLLEQAERIRALETQALKGEGFSIGEGLNDVNDPQLKKRLRCLEQVQAGQESAERFLQTQQNSAQERALTLVLKREIILDKRSPEDNKEKRLALQVKMLEEAMNHNRSYQLKVQQLRQLDNDWLENVVGAIPDALSQRFQ